MRRVPRTQRHHLTRYGDPKVAFDIPQAALARMESHALEDETVLKVYRCVTCQKWHLGNPVMVTKRLFPDVDRELFHLELGGRATACMWDESYRPEAGRAYQVRKRVRSALKLAAKIDGVGTRD